MRRARNFIFRSVALLYLWITGLVCLIHGLPSLNLNLRKPHNTNDATRNDRYDPQTFLKISTGVRVSGRYPTAVENSEPVAQLTQREFAQQKTPATNYVLEMLPENSESLQSGQWIFLRLCTTPARSSPKSSHYTLEAAIRKELQDSSCIAHDLERPKFPLYRKLVIRIHGLPAITYDLFSQQTLSTTLVQPRDVRFWSFNPRDTVLVGLRPRKTVEHQVIDVHLELSMEEDKTWNQANRGFEDETRIHHGNTVRAPLHLIHLKRFKVRFRERPHRLYLHCNKSRPVAIFHPSGSTRLPMRQTQSLRSFADETALNGADIINSLPLPSSALQDALEPDPMWISEMLDDLAIRRAQKKLQPNLSHQWSHLTPTSGLSLPDSPIPGTPTYIVELSEVLNFTCHSNGTKSKIKVIYDENIWKLVSYNENASLVHVILRASVVTWFNVTQNSANLCPKSVDQLTSVKCGTYRPKQTQISEAVTDIGEQPVTQLYLAIVSTNDYAQFKRGMLQKHTNTFSIDDFDTNGVPLSFDSLRMRLVNTVDRKKVANEKIGFWNLPLVKLSAVKLTISLTAVFLILSLIVLAICQYSHLDVARTEHPTDFQPTHSPETIPTWSSGDHISIPQANNSLTWQRNLIQRLKRRRTHRMLTNTRSDASIEDDVHSCDTNAHALVECTAQPVMVELDGKVTRVRLSRR